MPENRHGFSPHLEPLADFYLYLVSLNYDILTMNYAFRFIVCTASAFFFLTSFVSHVQAQCIVNGGFTNNNGSVNSIGNTVPGWSVSHGTPSLFGNGSQDPFSIWMWSYSSGGEGVYTNYAFQAGRTYRICMDVLCGNLPGSLGFQVGIFNVWASNNNFGLPPAANPNRQVIFSGNVTNQTFQTMTWVFTPTQNYAHLWICPFMTQFANAPAEQYMIQIDNIAINPIVNPFLNVVQNGPGAWTVTVQDSPDNGIWNWTSGNPNAVLQPVNDTTVQVFACDSLTLTGNFISNCTICDSYMLDTLLLNNNPIYLTDTVNVSICQGDSVLAGGSYQHNSGNYYDTLQTVSGCDSILVTQLTVTPAASGIYNLQICQGDSIQAGGNYYSSPGTYTVALQNQQGCDSLVTVYLAVSPAIQSAVTQNICQGDSVNISNTWYHAAGTFNISYTSVAGCDSIVTYTVNMFQAPVVDLGNDQSLCDVSSHILQPAGNFSTVIWQDGSTGNTYMATQTGTYWVEAISQQGCSGFDTIQLTFGHSPVSLLSDTSACDQNEVILTAGTPDMTYLWSNGSTNPQISILQTGDYWVTISNQCGSITDSFHVQMNASAAVFIPNVFTPNKDGLNEQFIPVAAQASDFHLTIFNRWGAIIYESFSPNFGWEGLTAKGDPVVAGVYLYLFEYTDCKQELTRKIGHVTVLR